MQNPFFFLYRSKELLNGIALGYRQLCHLRDFYSDPLCTGFLKGNVISWPLYEYLLGYLKKILSSANSPMVIG